MKCINVLEHKESLKQVKIFNKREIKTDFFYFSYFSFSFFLLFLPTEGYLLHVGRSLIFLIIIDFGFLIFLE